MDFKVVLKGVALTLPAGNAGSSGRAFPQLLELPQVVLTAYHSGPSYPKRRMVWMGHRIIWSKNVKMDGRKTTLKWWYLPGFMGARVLSTPFLLLVFCQLHSRRLRVLASMLKRLGQHLFFGVWKQNNGTSHLQFWEICFETSEWWNKGFLIMISFTISNPMILWWLWIIPQFPKSLGNSYDETHHLWLNRNGPMMSFTISNRQLKSRPRL